MAVLATVVSLEVAEWDAGARGERQQAKWS